MSLKVLVCHADHTGSLVPSPRLTALTAPSSTWTGKHRSIDPRSILTNVARKSRLTESSTVFILLKSRFDASRRTLLMLRYGQALEDIKNKKAIKAAVVFPGASGAAEHGL